MFCLKKMLFLDDFLSFFKHGENDHAASRKRSVNIKSANQIVAVTIPLATVTAVIILLQFVLLS